MKFYQCKVCGNIATLLFEKKDHSLHCCNQHMDEMYPKTNDGPSEKHVPVVNICNQIAKVQIGSIEHPMTQEHWITMIVLKTNQRIQIVHLNHFDKPMAEFLLRENEKIQNVYEYCNIHGLWKKEY